MSVEEMLHHLSTSKTRSRMTQVDAEWIMNALRAGQAMRNCIEIEAGEASPTYLMEKDLYTACQAWDAATAKGDDK